MRCHLGEILHDFDAARERLHSASLIDKQRHADRCLELLGEAIRCLAASAAARGDVIL
jgi:hypothetical protein